MFLHSFFCLSALESSLIVKLRRNALGNGVIFIFSGQKPCTRIHNFKHIAFFFTSFEGYKFNKLYEITPKKVLIHCKSLRKQTSKASISQDEILCMTILTVFPQFLWNLIFICSGSLKKLSWMLLQITDKLLLL